MKMPKLQLWKKSSLETHAISHVKWDYPNQRPSKNFLPMNWIHTTICRMYILLRMIFLYTYFTFNYDAPTA